MFAVLLFLLATASFIADANSFNKQGGEAVAYSSASSYSSAYSENHSASSYSSSTSRIDNGKEPSNPPNTGNNNGTLNCGDNEVVDECPAICLSDFCPTGDRQNQRCPIPYPCNLPPTCKCKLNYRRNRKTKKCVPASECPPFPCLKPNEEYNRCPPYCPTDDCSMATPSGKCPLSGNINTERACLPTCRCKNGYWRDNDICVPYNQCPEVMA